MEQQPDRDSPGASASGRRIEVAAMMRLVVREGTGTAAQISGYIGRRQDGNGRDRHRELEHDVVHRVRRKGR